MKIQFLSIFLSLTITICIEPNERPITSHIVFSNGDIKISEEGSIIKNDTAVLIQNPGVFLVSGESEEGNIIVKSDSVTLYLQNLYLSSKKNSPIIVTKNLKDIKIANIENTTLNDLENKKTTTGECAVIKIGKNSVVYIGNNDVFTLNGECRDVIKGGEQTSIIFEKTSGEYIINSKKTAIESDGLLQFNGGTFTINSENGDAIKSEPSDEKSLGKILINYGKFNIHCFNDAFTAKNNITIYNGKFEITTEEGYDSESYNETESAKGFKLTNNETGCGITIYSGDFKLNTADDAFRSNRDITILSGDFEIYTKDDAICAKYDLVIGEKNAPLEELFINVKKSYEALEGMTVTIYSGKIICNAKDDGINASGPIKKERNRRPRNGSEWGRRNFTNDSEHFNRNDSRRNNSGFPFDEDAMKRNHVGAPPNDSFIISIFGGEIYVYTDSDGIDCNGHLYIHGGDINIFSEGKGANEPIDHNGNFTLFNAEILGVGTGGLEYVHEGIKKGNQMYAFYSGTITKNKKLEIYNEKDVLVKEGEITKDINYIFYTSSKLNKNYHFYIFDEKNEKNDLNVKFGMPEEGEDDEDKKYINPNPNKKVKEEDKTEDSKFLRIILLGIIIFLF